MKKLAIGNYAVARGAYEAGVRVASAYPGTPSTEITEFIAQYGKTVNAEWSPNEKVALEVGVGASIAGARTLVCMKHVGLNVAADPLFTAAYTGVNGGLVIIVADDPGMHSSQNEQDSRYYAMSAHVPMLEPADSEECKEYTKLAFELSERYDTPVLLRLTTRVAHSQSLIEECERKEVAIKDYVKDPAKYVMMPGNAIKRHVVVEAREHNLDEDCNALECNVEESGETDLGFIVSGNAYQYVKEAFPQASVFKLGMVYPLPMERIKAFAKKVKRLIIVEELEPIFETQIKAHGIACEGKDLFGRQGELSVSQLLSAINHKLPAVAEQGLPMRPPIMCAGCPHRGVFYEMSQMKLRVFGDIGCYTLGALAPLSSVDAVLCMGASIGMAIGWEKVHGFDHKTVAVIGDSTFAHSGLTGLVNAVYNGLNTKLVILDNSTTGMTGHQPNPTTGYNIYEEKTHALDLVDVAKACGVTNIATVDAYDLDAVKKTLSEQLQLPGVSVIIARRVCVLIDKVRDLPSKITEKCVGCKACMKIGCPSIELVNGKPQINPTLCNGCGVCSQVCKFGAIEKGGKRNA